MDVNKIREQFPILKKGIIYFDNSCTTLTPEVVLEAVLDYYRNYRGCVHRGLHRFSRKATEEYEKAHEKVAKFIGAKKGELMFTKNTTESLNLIAWSLDLKKGDKVVTTAIEHHSNLMPWIKLKKEKGINLEIVSPDKEGIFNLEDFKKAAEGAKVISVTHVSNVLGSITPVEEIGKIAKKNGALFIVDGAQSVPHFKIDVKKIGCDFLGFSAHKMLGPTGVGGLYIRKDLAEKLEPVFIGGGTISSVKLDSYNLTEPPDRWEAGTPNIAGGIGFGRAVEYLESIGMNNIENHERELTKQLLDLISEVKNVELYGPDVSKRVGVVPFNVKGMNPHDVASMFDEIGSIMVRSGHSCAMPLMNNIIKRPEGVVRASLYLYNTKEEVEKFISMLKDITKLS